MSQSHTAELKDVNVDFLKKAHFSSLANSMLFFSRMSQIRFFIPGRNKYIWKNTRDKMCYVKSVVFADKRSQETIWFTVNVQ